MRARLALAFLVLLPAMAQADTQTIRCYAPHFSRSITFPQPPPPPALPPQEVRLTVIYINNGDPVNAAIVERLTWRDEDGAILVQSVFPTHPPSMPSEQAGLPTLNLPIPAGATLSFSTLDLLPAIPPPGSNQVPQFALGTGRSLTLEVSKRGKRSLLLIHAREIARDGAPGGAERTATAAPCFRIADGDGD